MHSSPSSTPIAIKALVKNNKYKIGHAILAVSAVAVIAFGLSSFWQSIEPQAADNASQKVIAAQDQSTPLAAPSPTVQQDAKETVEVIDTDATELDKKQTEATVTAELQPSERLTNALNTLRENISNDGAELEHPMAGTNQDYFGLRRQMLNAIKQDPLLLDTLLELFEQDPNSLLGRELAAVLSATGSPKAQTLALDMATDASLFTNEERAAALMMVADMDGITSETRDRLLGNIQQETESDLTQFSLIALKTGPSTADDHANVQRVLLETLNSDDDHVRRHAASKIEQWATSSDDLAPLRTMATEETDLNVRVRAVMSLGKSTFKNTENKNILYAVAANDENPVIRLRAWQALETFPLSDSEKADYNELGQRIQLEVEAYEATMSGN